MTELVGKTNTVSTHSRPKAAGADNLDLPRIKHLFQHTAARRRLAVDWQAEDLTAELFQHTAARRRLVFMQAKYLKKYL